MKKTIKKIFKLKRRNECNICNENKNRAIRLSRFEDDMLKHIQAASEYNTEADENSYDKNVVIVAGFGQSGNSAVRDFLGELDDFYIPDTEDFLIKYAAGLADLKAILLHNNNYLTADFIIKGFLRNVMIFESRYSKFYNNHFIPETARLIKGLIKGYYEVSRVPFNWPQYEGNDMLPFKGLVFFPKRFTEDEIDSLIRTYLSRLLTYVTPKKNICLVNSLQNGNLTEGLCFFNNARVITCARDVRDVYMDFKINAPNSSFIPLANVEQLSWFFDSVYKDYPVSSPQILNIRFENLVLNYDQTTQEILQFLNIPKSAWNAQKTLFDPEKSIKNIGLWREHKDNPIIHEIGKKYHFIAHNDPIINTN